MAGEHQWDVGKVMEGSICTVGGWRAELRAAGRGCLAAAMASRRVHARVIEAGIAFAFYRPKVRWRAILACPSWGGRGVRDVSSRGVCGARGVLGGRQEGLVWPKPWASGLFGLGRGHTASQVSPAPAYGAVVGHAQGGGGGEMQGMANS